MRTSVASGVAPSLVTVPRPALLRLRMEFENEIQGSARVADENFRKIVSLRNPWFRF